MDPNQQPIPPQSPEPAPQPAPAPVTPAYTQPTSQPYLSGPTAEPTTYDPNYLDSIAPGPARPTFFSGSFGKIFFAMLGVFVFAVSLIIAFSGGDKTADLQQSTVRVTNFVLMTKTEQVYIQSNKLNSTNSSFTLLLTNAETDGVNLLKQAGVQKSNYDRTMVASETKLTTDLTAKFENSRLNANLDSDYARTMAAETAKLILLFKTMSTHSGAQAIRDYAARLVTNLTPLQKSFGDYVNDGN